MALRHARRTLALATRALATLALATPALASFLLAIGCGGSGSGERGLPVGASGASAASSEPPVPWVPPEVLVAGSPVEQFGQLKVMGTQLSSQSGNPVQLKGVSTMWLNWEARLAGSKGGLEWMRDNWGLTVIRAAMGIEPAGAFLGDPARAELQVRAIVQNAIDLGVYVIVDWHDHTAQMHRAQAVEFFSKMALEFGEYPNVIWEPFNEPTNVDWSTVVKPYHEAVLAAIRASDPDNIVVLGNPQWDQRPDMAAANPVAGTNLMYSLHFYSCTHGAGIRNNAQRAYDAGVPLFVTEWGATNADGGKDGMVCEAAAQEWHDWLDQRNISWSAWRLQGCTNEQSCVFANAGVPAEGPWTADMLHGHGPFVVERMLD